VADVEIRSQTEMTFRSCDGFFNILTIGLCSNGPKSGYVLAHPAYPVATPLRVAFKELALCNTILSQIYMNLTKLKLHTF
jgi:hypothetical protein